MLLSGCCVRVMMVFAFLAKFVTNQSIRRSEHTDSPVMMGRILAITPFWA